MIETIIRKIFGDPSEKRVRQYSAIVDQIKIKEKEFQNLKPEDIKQRTHEFKEMFKWLDFRDEKDSEKILKILDDIMVDAFALVKTACKLLDWKKFDLEWGKTLTWNMIPYDVQLVWWLAIHKWSISEMKTWEWKTLVATLPAYLNCLTWNSVHIVTVNEYLATRDASEMWILYEMLWVTTWVIKNSQSREEKRQEYKKDIVYATNNELGFDYLRDNMVIRYEDKMQSKLFFAIIDEVDSILIDEARTPLIISAPDNEPTTKYKKFATLAKSLEKWVDYKIDEKQRSATLTEDWIKNVEQMLKIDNIYVSAHYNDIHHIENAIKANGVYKKDRDYLVSNWEVLIIDEHTWRVLSWRRYSEGLHQAIEAKEWVEIKQESRTLASITFQNYFRMYWKLSGMTWTAKTEEEEFYKVYALETLVIPTNMPLIRDDRKDLLFKNEKWKFEYVLKLIKDLHKTGQPILVWTVSVEKSEYLSSMLEKEKIPHSVLNAKYHKEEAEIISKAWQKWAITIATNMAWRWTDIKLWEWVKDLWWLIILWTEKHETRRIDNQLRWRAGRQWDPWMTQFLISPNDDIMRIFGWDKLFWVFNSPVFASIPDNEPLAQSWMLTRKVEWVQKQVEWHNFDARKHLLEYDDVINKHREIIYSRRNKILLEENIDEDIKIMIWSQVNKLVLSQSVNEWEKIDKKSVINNVNEFLWIQLIDDKIENDDIQWIDTLENLWSYISDLAISEVDKLRESAKEEKELYDLEKKIVLSSIDELWMRHIDAMSRLREEVAFEWYAQKNPLVVYKEKAYWKFNNLIDEIEYKTVKAMFSVNKISEVDEFDLSSIDSQTSEEEMWNLLENFLFKDIDMWEKNNSWNNPLFAKPSSAPNNTKKRNIRV